MNGRDRLTHSLNKPVVVRKGTIHLGKGRCGKDNVSEGGRVGLKEFLNNQEIELGERFFATSQLLFQETPRQVKCADVFPCCIEHLSRAQSSVHDAHIVCADAIVKEWQRMQKYPPAF